MSGRRGAGRRLPVKRPTTDCTSKKYHVLFLYQRCLNFVSLVCDTNKWRSQEGRNRLWNQRKLKKKNKKNGHRRRPILPAVVPFAAFARWCSILEEYATLCRDPLHQRSHSDVTARGGPSDAQPMASSLPMPIRQSARTQRDSQRADALRNFRRLDRPRFPKFFDLLEYF